MLNLVRMDLYRIFRMKSLYVTFIIYALFDFLTTTISNFSIDGSAPVLSVSELLATMMSTMMMLLFLMIFVAIMLMSDVGGGFIKSYVGQLRHKSYRIISKFVCMLIYIALFMAAAFAFQIIANAVVFGTVKMGNMSELIKYMGVIYLLTAAIGSIIVFVASGAKSLVLPIIFAVLLANGGTGMVTSLVDFLMRKLKIDFELSKYDISAYFIKCDPGYYDEKLSFILPLACAYIVVFTVLACMRYEHKDVI